MYCLCIVYIVYVYIVYCIYCICHTSALHITYLIMKLVHKFHDNRSKDKAVRQETVSRLSIFDIFNN